VKNVQRIDADARVRRDCWAEESQQTVS